MANVAGVALPIWLTALREKTMTVPRAILVLGAKSNPWSAKVTLLALPVTRYVPGLVLVNPSVARLFETKEPQFELVICKVRLTFCGSAIVTESKGLIINPNGSETGCGVGRLIAGPPPVAATRITVLLLPATPP